MNCGPTSPRPRTTEAAIHPMRMLATIAADAPADAFPPVSLALGLEDEAPGLLAVGGDLSVPRLLQAYRRGIFPWYADAQPILWWSPDPRMALRPDEFKISRSLRQSLRRFAQRPGHEIRIDHDFAAVLHACALTPRDGQHGTWIVPEMRQAYQALHRAGHAHSIETWIDDQLVGGLYGVRIGRMFYGESMFAWRTDASKIALAALVALCRRDGLPLIDCQQRTGHLASLGAREMPRRRFVQEVDTLCRQTPPAPWFYDRDLWKHLP